MQVFHDKEHRLLGGDAQQDGQEGVQDLLLLPIGRHGQGGIVRRQRQGEEARPGGVPSSASGRPYCTRKPSSLLELLRAGTRPARSAAPPAPADRSGDRRRCAGDRANTDGISHAWGSATTAP